MILLAPVYAGTYLEKNGFMGTVYRSRGASGAYNISEKYDVICTTAWSWAKLVCTGSTPGVRIVQTTYNNTGYYALYFPTKSINKITLDGLFWGDPIEISNATGYPVTEVTYNTGPYAIVEHGISSAGEWVKFSNGWMIQYARVAMSFSNSTVARTIFNYLTPFVKAGDPATRYQTRKAFTIAQGADDTYAGMMMADVGANDNYVHLTYRITAPRTADRLVEVFVIGRWKK